MMLGHSIIPHHHHRHVEDFKLFGNSHDEFHSGTDSGHDHGPLENVFSLVPHGQKGLECISCPNMDETFTKQCFDFTVIDLIFIEMNIPGFPFEDNFYEYSELFDVLGYSPPGGLRAPPFFS
jgi:hypothetical protein